MPHPATCLVMGILVLQANVACGSVRFPIGCQQAHAHLLTRDHAPLCPGFHASRLLPRATWTDAFHGASRAIPRRGVPRSAAAAHLQPPPKTVSSDSFTDRLATFLAQLGRAAPLAFMGLFVINTVLCLPTALMSLAGGFLFGAAWGALYVWVGAMLGASVAFGISRRWGQTWIQQRIARRPWLLALEQAVSEEGWKIIVLARLAPGSPFFILNYLFGLTRVRFRDYFWSTAISVFPGSFLLVYLGSLGHRALAGHIRSPYEWALYGVGLVALGAAVWLIARRAHRILNQKLGAAHPPPVSRLPE